MYDEIKVSSYSGLAQARPPHDTRATLSEVVEIRVLDKSSEFENMRP